MRSEITAVTDAHIRQVASNLRPSEHDVYVKMYGDIAARIKYECDMSAVTFAGLVDGHCIVIWGVITDNLLAQRGYIWVLGTEDVDKYPILFLRYSRRVLAAMRQMFTELYAIVLDNNPTSGRWMTWLGFASRPTDGPARYFWI